MWVVSLRLLRGCWVRAGDEEEDQQGDGRYTLSPTGGARRPAFVDGAQSWTWAARHAADACVAVGRSQRDVDTAAAATLHTQQRKLCRACSLKFQVHDRPRLVGQLVGTTSLFCDSVRVFLTVVEGTLRGGRQPVL